MKSKKISKERAESMLRQIHNILDAGECRIKIGYSKKYAGFYELDGKKEVISLNPWNELVKTLIHECAHARNFGVNSDNESEIYDLEDSLFECLSAGKIKSLAKKLMLGKTITQEDFKKIPTGAAYKKKKGA